MKTTYQNLYQKYSAILTDNTDEVLTDKLEETIKLKCDFGVLIRSSINKDWTESMKFEDSVDKVVDKFIDELVKKDIEYKGD